MRDELDEFHASAVSVLHDSGGLTLLCLGVLGEPVAPNAIGHRTPPTRSADLRTMSDGETPSPVLPVDGELLRAPSVEIAKCF